MQTPKVDKRFSGNDVHGNNYSSPLYRRQALPLVKGHSNDLDFRRPGLLAKFGRWLDLAVYQLVLDTPLSPVAG